MALTDLLMYMQNIQRQEWVDEKEARGVSHAFVWNDSEFKKVDPANTDYLLGGYWCALKSCCLSRLCT